MAPPRTEISVSAHGETIATLVVEPGEYVIGSGADCALIAAVEGVAERHAMVTVNFQDLVLEDLGSAHGTHVAGKPVTEPTRLWPGQSVQLGAATLTTRRVRSEDGGESLLPWTEELRKQLPEDLRSEGRYAIRSLVAQGGMGAILDAKDQTIRRTVAMKVMLDPRFQDDMVRFIEEAQVTGQLEHPNIVPIYELGVDAHEQVFYTMKFVRGVTLKQVLEQLAAGTAGISAKYPLATLLTVFQKVCDAVAFAHSRGVVHRDLKPENVMIGDYGEVLVMDWGLAKTLARREPGRAGEGAVAPAPVVCVPRGDGEALPSIKSARTDSGEQGATLAGMVLGTPNFMSPEQAAGRVAEIDARSDIFTLGGILYSILTLQLPFTGETVEEILEKVVSGRITPAAQLVSSSRRKRGAKDSPAATTVAPAAAGWKHLPGGRVPDSLSAVAMKALAREPADRYQSVPELQKDIEAYQGGFATRAERAGALKQIALLVKRHRAASLGFAAVLLVGATFGSRALLEGRRAERSLAELRGTAPTFAAQSRALLAEGDLAGALAKIGYAATLAPENADYLLTRAHLLQSTQDLPRAVAEYRRVLALRAGDEAATANLALSERLLAAKGGAPGLSVQAQSELLDALIAQRRDLESAPLSKLLRRDSRTNEATLRARLAPYAAQPNWKATRISTLPGGGFAVELSDLQPGDLSVLRGLPIVSLMLNRTIVSDLTPLAGLPLSRLQIMETKVTDLSPLRGLKIRDLDMSRTTIADLSPLAGMPLEYLSIPTGRISNISPLRGARLVKLVADINPKLTDLTALTGMPLKMLSLGSTGVKNLSPLRGMPLRELNLHDAHQVVDLRPVAHCPTLEEIRLPYQAFADVATLATLPKLKKVEFSDGQRNDQWLSPAEFLARYGSPSVLAARAALAPAGTIPLWRVSADADQRLNINLKQYPFADLTPIQGQPIKRLNLEFTRVQSLEPLRGMSLVKLELARSQVNSVEPLRGMPLAGLYLYDTKVRDVSPLADCVGLEELELPDGAINVEALRSLKKLRYLSFRWNEEAHRPAQTPEEFWQEFDAKAKGPTK